MLLTLVGQLVGSPERVTEREWSEEKQIRSDMPQSFPPEPPPGMPEIEHRPGLAKQTLRELAPSRRESDGLIRINPDASGSLRATLESPGAKNSEIVGAGTKVEKHAELEARSCQVVP